MHKVLCQEQRSEMSQRNLLYSFSKTKRKLPENFFILQLLPPMFLLIVMLSTLDVML